MFSEPRAASIAGTATDEPRIVVRDVSKIYHLYQRPSDRLKQTLFGDRKKLYREFWALRDVSFEVRAGETFGIIGRNGAGKSTLLQMLAGVLRTSRGSIDVRGRIAALLELGAGFQPEFTGRENVFLNAAILGVAGEEARRRFSEIVEFADIGPFIDQPVKTYSSGMLVRLAFAVTTCLDPDVLLVDEALAVGDVFFQQKCYRRLEELRARGTAIVFVSHAMPEVAQFCHRALLLHEGRPLFLGSAADAVARYYQLDFPGAGEPAAAAPSAATAKSCPDGDELDGAWPTDAAGLNLDGVQTISDGTASCRSVALCDASGRPVAAFEQNDRLSIFCEFEVHRDIGIPVVGCMLVNAKGQYVHGKNSLQTEQSFNRPAKAGDRVRARIDVDAAVECGEYTFDVSLATISPEDYARRGSVPHLKLAPTIRRICDLTSVGRFAVVWRRSLEPVQLLHYGIASLPGTIQVAVRPATRGVSQPAIEPKAA